MKRKTAHNSTYPKGGFSYSKDSFVQAESLVLQLKFSGENPALRVAAKRYGQLPCSKFFILSGQSFESLLCSFNGRPQ
jgi:hypothetical protein